MKIGKTQQLIDIIECEKEPIHIPGCIQPHGVLLVLQEPELKIVQLSKNVEEFFGYSAENLLNKPLAVLFDTAEIASLQEHFYAQDISLLNPLRLCVQTAEKKLIFDGIVHRTNNLLLLELELSDEHTSLQDFYHLSRFFIEKLRHTLSLQHLCQIAVEEVHRITNFDRVMMYRFDQDWNGVVISEKKFEEAVTFLGLHFPAMDIPSQARELYRQNWLRLIVDVDYKPVPLFPNENPVTHEPLNLSLSVLRSVSPLHLEYLKNMGVHASFCITLLKENTLWGMIVCHHLKPKHLSYEKRMLCELLGQVVSAQLSAKVDYEEHLYEVNVKTRQAQLLGVLSKEENVVDGLVKHGIKVLELANATGMALCFEDRYVTLGTLPAESAVKELVIWLRQRGDMDVFHSNTLPSLYKAAENWMDVGSGLIAIPISKMQGSYVLWFRPEVIQTVNWGGNPNELVVTQDMRLHPRRSFEQWKQTITMTAMPWKSCEISAVLELRSILVDMALRDIILKQTLHSWLNQP